MNSQFVKNRLFEGINPDFLSALHCGMRERTFDAGEVIFTEGEPGSDMFLIGNGAVTISKIGRGNQQEVLATLDSEDFFGEMALLEDAPRSARATAETRTMTGAIDRETMEKMAAA